MKMEILLEPTSNKLMVGDLCDSIRIKLVTTGKKRWCDSIRIKLVPARNPVKEILLKLNYCLRLLALDPLTEFKVTPTKHRRMTNPYSSPRFIANYLNARYLKMEVKRRSVKVKELQERCIIKAFKLTNPEKYEHVSPNVTSLQDGKVYKMATRDYAWLMISRSSRSHSR
ncbi:hypothetical protein Tco_0374330 [Tanacetum coccineum]